MLKTKILKFTIIVVAVLALGVGIKLIKNNTKSEVEKVSNDVSINSQKISSDIVKTKKEMILIYSDTCPHCHDAMEFIDKHIEPRFKDLTVKKYNIRTSEGNKIFKEYIKKFNITGRYGVPFVIIGNDYQMGFAGDLTGEKYINLIEDLK